MLIANLLHEPLIDRLSLRSESTQSSTLQALKFFYEYLYQKHDVTFCLSFHLSGYNPSIATSELEAWAYLILKRVYTDKYQSVMRSCRLAEVDFAMLRLNAYG